MPDILLRDVPAEMKKQIEDLAHKHRHSLSSEAKRLLEGALSLLQSEGARGAEGIGASSLGAGGLGARLRGLVAEEDWTDDFIQPRDSSERAPPDFE